MRHILFLLLFFSGTGANMSGQAVTTTVNGWTRAGLYAELYDFGGTAPFSSLYTDAGIRADVRNSINFKAYVDLRYRYGSEFRAPVSQFQVREAYITVYGRKLEFVIGQRIVKWGRADFDNPTSSLNPRNYFVRSPEMEDIDLGNISASFIYKPAGFISLQAIVAPMYRSDVMITTLLNIPHSVTIEEINGLVALGSFAGWGAKADLYLRPVDLSFSFFEGYVPLPGIRFRSLDMIESDEGVQLFTTLAVTPYRVKRYGADFETIAGRYGVRGEVAFTEPELSFRVNEEVPMPEIKWALGADILSGIFTLGAEYFGKFITDYELSPLQPVVPGDIPPLTPEQIGAIPGGPEAFATMQIAAFNRLYMYQLKEYYHSLGVHVEADLAAGKIAPSLYMVNNLTTGEIALVPSIKIKPADGLSIIAGADIYKGKEGSLYDIIDRPLSSLFLSVRVDF
jgi:hypothetical protein